MLFTVNHNGTEDWAELPSGATRLPDGRAAFGTMDAAIGFAAQIARDVIAFEMREWGKSEAAARDSLRPTAEGVPVQVVDADSGEVIGTITPETFALDFGEEA
jgi:ribosomal protein L16/L10AE